jgi:hypothetical protein
MTLGNHQICIETLASLPHTINKIGTCAQLYVCLLRYSLTGAVIAYIIDQLCICHEGHKGHTQPYRQWVLWTEGGLCLRYCSTYD